MSNRIIFEIIGRVLENENIEYDVKNLEIEGIDITGWWFYVYFKWNNRIADIKNKVLHWNISIKVQENLVIWFNLFIRDWHIINLEWYIEIWSQFGESEMKLLLNQSDLNYVSIKDYV